MSRREEEFKHRTSIFEGAYRAWSHLGGLDAEILDVKLARELDPISYPHLNDTRDPVKKTKNVNDDGSARLDCPYEPLPRSGLSHPFIQAILAPWLGPNAEKDAVELGLATLRTWWQHRRKGENKSSVKTLGTAKMRIVVDKYTRHFFDLAHCLVVSDDATPPRTLHTKMKQLAKGRRGPCADMLMDHLDDELSLPAVSAMRATLLDPNPSPLEKLHAAQMQHSTGFVMSTDMINVGPLVNVKGKCIPGKIDLPGMVEAINRHSNQLAFTGGLINRDTGDGVTEGEEWQGRPVSYGDPKSAPVVFQNTNGDNFIVMNVNGITCAHCVKIVETVLKGCNGGKSPIAGLLDAAADRGLSCVMIQIEHFKYAKRVAFESARNLSLVGYTAVAKEVHVIGSNDDSSAASDIEMLQNAIVKLAKAYPFQFFDFNASCSCPDSGVFRDNCPRHSQMDDRMFTALANHERHLADCIDSKYRGKEHNDAVRRFDEPAFETFSQGIVPSGMRVRPDYDVLYIKPLTIEQSMQLPSADVPLDLIEKASDLEPIPLGELQLSSKAMFEDADDRVNSVEQLFQQPTVAVPRYSYTSGSGDHRVSISALAIDWSLDMLDYDAEGMEHLDMGDDIGIIPQNNVQSLSQPTNESYEI